MKNSIVCVICHASGYTACAHRPHYEAAKAEQPVSSQPDAAEALSKAILEAHAKWQENT